MPRNTTVPVPAHAWTEITDANVASITFQNQCSTVLLVKGTVGSVTPTDDLGSIVYPPMSGEVSAILTELFPGVTGVNRVFVKPVTSGWVAVGHA